jgi:hypothetical protein
MALYELLFKSAIKASESPNSPIPWYKKAKTVCKSYSAKTRGQYGVHHKIYLIMLKGVDGEKPGYALYVGQTGLTPEERFQRHKNGVQSSGVVRKYGKRLLPDLYKHLNPMSYEESMKLEHDIFQALVKAGVPVHGGH